MRSHLKVQRKRTINGRHLSTCQADLFLTLMWMVCVWGSRPRLPKMFEHVSKCFTMQTFLSLCLHLGVVVRTFRICKSFSSSVLASNQTRRLIIKPDGGLDLAKTLFVRSKAVKKKLSRRTKIQNPSYS